MKNVILIPAYNPDYSLINLIEDLVSLKMLIVVVNDGSEKCYDYIFICIKNEFYIEVINHEKNKGKEVALKTGIRYLQ